MLRINDCKYRLKRDPSAIGRLAHKCTKHDSKINCEYNGNSGLHRCPDGEPTIVTTEERRESCEQ